MDFLEILIVLGNMRVKTKNNKIFILVSLTVEKLLSAALFFDQKNKQYAQHIVVLIFVKHFFNHLMNIFFEMILRRVIDSV